MRKIPTSMATQHPDNSCKPYWNYQSFISTAAEIQECFRCFSDLGIDEYNWDWEGKFVDEAVVDRLLTKHLKYFEKNPLGKDKFLTFRIPNPRVEKQFRLGRAFMVIITSSQLSKSLGFSDPPIFETILPLTESAEEIIDIQEAFRSLIRLEHKLLQMEESVGNIEIIPLFEQVSTIMNSGSLIKKYIRLHKSKFKLLPEYIRPYCARSDPALNSGLIPTILSIKVASSSFIDVEYDTGVKLYPMLGSGSLPFRGGLTPQRVQETAKEYAGFRTFTVQSAFRYDSPQKSVIKAIEELKELLPATKAVKIDDKTVQYIKKVIPYFEIPYRKSIEKLAPLVNKISSIVPKRRERVQHIGLFGYSRGVGNVKLPRAIPFTASLYSLGIPPELIGTGRGIKEAKKAGLLDLVKKLHHNLLYDLSFAGSFVNMDNLFLLSKKDEYFKDILEDVKAVEKEIGLSIKPTSDAQKEHYKISTKIYNYLKEGKDISKLIAQAGTLRHSLG
jgi:phosphoenolpyruvate carboxylase